MLKVIAKCLIIIETHWDRITDWWKEYSVKDKTMQRSNEKVI